MICICHVVRIDWLGHVFHSTQITQVSRSLNSGRIGMRIFFFPTHITVYDDTIGSRKSLILGGASQLEQTTLRKKSPMCLTAFPLWPLLVPFIAMFNNLIPTFAKSMTFKYVNIVVIPCLTRNSHKSVSDLNNYERKIKMCV